MVKNYKIDVTVSRVLFEVVVFARQSQPLCSFTQKCF